MFKMGFFSMNLFDQVWIRLVKIGGFLLGAWIMYHEVTRDPTDRPYLYAAALMMMGLQLAETLTRFIETMAQFLTFMKTTEAGKKQEKRKSKNRGVDDGNNS